MTDLELVAALAESVGAALAAQDEKHRLVVERLLAELVEVRELVKAIPAPRDGNDGRDGVDGKDGLDGADGKAGADGKDGVSVHGKDGADGRDGRDGKDGIASRDEVRSEAAKAVDERIEVEVQKRVAAAVAALPVMIYRGTYQEGTEYVAGSVVSWAGSGWHANEATTEKPGDGSKSWTLFVKKGRDASQGVATVADVRREVQMALSRNGR